MVNAWPLVDALLRPALCRATGSELSVADGWIDEGWKHVTGAHSKLSG